MYLTAHHAQQELHHFVRPQREKFSATQTQKSHSSGLVSEPASTLSTVCGGKSKLFRLTPLTVINEEQSEQSGR